MGLKYENASGVKRDFKKAFSYYQKAAKSGYPEGMFRLGECFLYARGVSTNVGKAVYWLTKAADKGDSQAQCDLATLYDLGQSVEKNEKKAIRYYQKAAAQENVTAMAYLAGHYLEGDYGLAKNEARAIDLLKKARKKVIQKFLAMQPICWLIVIKMELVFHRIFQRHLNFIRRLLINLEMLDAYLRSLIVQSMVRGLLKMRKKRQFIIKEQLL